MMQFSQDSGYMPNLFPNTSIQPNPMVLSRNCLLLGHTLWLRLMETYRSDWLLLRPLMLRPICPSIQVFKQNIQNLVRVSHHQPSRYARQMPEATSEPWAAVTTRGAP